MVSDSTKHGYEAALWSSPAQDLAAPPLGFGGEWSNVEAAARSLTLLCTRGLSLPHRVSNISLVPIVLRKLLEDTIYTNEGVNLRRDTRSQKSGNPT